VAGSHGLPRPQRSHTAREGRDFERTLKRNTDIQENKHNIIISVSFDIINIPSASTAPIIVKAVGHKVLKNIITLIVVMRFPEECDCSRNPALPVDPLF
jgi:hypothetical protein